jgi:hypothetical protein
VKQLLVVFWLAAFSSTAFGEEPQQPAPDSQSRDMIAVDQQHLLWYTVHYQGKEFGMAWGLDGEVLDRLKTVPSAKGPAELYQVTNLLSNIGYWGGEAGLLFSAACIPTSPNQKAPVAALVGVEAGMFALVSSYVLAWVGSANLRSAIEAYDHVTAR